MAALYPQFEYQQAGLEAGVENLSWKVERAEITDRVVVMISKIDSLQQTRTTN